MRKIALLLVTTVLLTFASELDYDITRVKTVSDDDYIPSLVVNLERTIDFFNYNQGHGYVDMSKVLKWLETFESLEEYSLVRIIPRGGVVIGRAKNSQYVPTIIGYFEEALKMVEDVKMGPFDDEDEEEEALQERQEFISIWKEAVNSLAEFKYAVSLDKDVYLRRKYTADYEREELPRVSSLDSLAAYRAGLDPPQVGIIGAATTSGLEDTTLKLEIPGITEDEVNSLIGVMVVGTRIPKELPSERPSELIEDLRWLHFKKFIVTDGEQTWEWDL
ncbi:MAG: hypothetical protein E3J71_06230 [Candidatus Stahlbacteria bacterium]|nr:MAG: hypothetical protein E3J71_06230 [Candidatus Stahlbacteria bacterium]